MELYQIKAFVAVAEEKNLTKAAEVLFLTQPALSNQLKALEDELGVKLFKRDAKGMTLTHAGDALFKEAKELLYKADDFIRKAANFKSGLSGKINLGLNTKSEILKANKICKIISEKFSDLKLNIVQSITPEIIKNIKKGVLDAGFIFGSSIDSGFERIILSEMKMSLVYPVKFQEKITDLCDIRGLSEIPWILFDKECPFKNVLDDFFEKYEIAPKKFMHTNQESIINSLVRSGQGISIMLKDEADVAVKNKEAMIFSDIDLNIELSFVYLKEEKTNPLIKNIVEIIKDVWKN